MNAEDFYRAFEDKFRGPRELIKSRLEVYLPFVMPLKEIYDECNVFDIGCGRGEWLELMTENGFNATGVDIDDGMLAACKELGLNAINKDALLALKELPNETQVVVSGFHIAEHLPFEILLEIVKEAKRVLKPGGLLILETPNPANISVGTNNFYLDPTHNRPIPLELLSFLTEFYGYRRTKALGLQHPKEFNDSTTISLQDIYKNSSPDSSVIAQKNAIQKTMALFDSAFKKNYGLTVEKLCSIFEENIINRLNSIELKSQSAETKAASAEERAACAETKAAFTEAALNAIYSSRSWKITAPYRSVGDFIKNCNQNTKNTLKPLAAKCVGYIENRPKLRIFCIQSLHRVPKIESRLRSFYYGYYLPKRIFKTTLITDKESNLNEAPVISENFIPIPLSQHSQLIYDQLKREIESRKGVS